MRRPHESNCLRFEGNKKEFMKELATAPDLFQEMLPEMDNILENIVFESVSQKFSKLAKYWSKRYLILK